MAPLSWGAPRAAPFGRLTHQLLTHESLLSDPWSRRPGREGRRSWFGQCHCATWGVHTSPMLLSRAWEHLFWFGGDTDRISPAPAPEAWLSPERQTYERTSVIRARDENSSSRLGNA